MQQQQKKNNNKQAKTKTRTLKKQLKTHKIKSR